MSLIKYKYYIPALFILHFLVGCSTNQHTVTNSIKHPNYGSKITVKPKIVVESAYEGFYVSDKLEKELNKIEFSSTNFLKGNEACIGLVRLSISGSIDYYQLIKTLKKRTYDMGGNAIGLYDYQESRKVFVNQQGYKVYDKNRTFFDQPKIKYVLVKENRKVAKITADIFKCNKQST